MNYCIPKHQIAVGIGDVSWAQQCFRLAVSLDPAHAEAWNNLAVLEMRRGSDEQARRLPFWPRPSQTPVI